ncbi:unnamed protein product [Prorocentrum cordatum]|uniref:Uncharacterized protein n=1 Tax=Prorocentrum cordatum TaxID=2364126 RepID=A0ABN9T9U6_9DINO|nr:unnamed protein product [Polarella glacialis]
MAAPGCQELCAEAVAVPLKSYRDDTQGRGGDKGTTRDLRSGVGGELMEKIEWNGEEVVPVRKDFAFLHPNVEAKPEEDPVRCKLR